MHNVTKIVQDRVSSSSPKTMYVNVEGPISSIALNRDASQVVVGGRTVFKIYNIDEDRFEEKHNLRVGKHINLNFCASDIAWNHIEDNILATGATNGAVVVWDLNRHARSKQEHVFQEHKRTVNRVSFHEKENNMLLSASQDCSMKLFDTRKKECSLSFSSGSTSVRDIQFSPYNLSYFTFASADEGGNIQIWDMRRPDKVERQFMAHGGPVFAIDWHPDDRNLFATAGRDKMIKVWDLGKSKATHMIYSIAAVARIRWRPQRRFHIASCSLLVDCSINIWDIRRPYVPFATFDSHKDVTTSILFKNKDPHVLLSGSKDSYLYQHVFKDAKRPAEDLVPAGLDLSVFGVVGHANSDSQGKLITHPGGGGIMSSMSSMLPSGKKMMVNSEKFVDVSTYMQVFSDQEQKISLSWLVESAMRYRLIGSSMEELCHHNAKVAHELGRTQVAHCWMLLMTLYSADIVAKTQPRSQSVISSTNTERGDLEKGKTASDKNTELELDEKTIETSGNSDDENDDKDLFETKLSSIARGQINTDWDFYFDDGGFSSYDLNNMNGPMDNKQQWSLPCEAFQPRHEIHDRETPIETLQNHHNHHHGQPETQLSAAVDSDVASSKVNGGTDTITNNIITTDAQYFQNPDWDCSAIVIEMLKKFAEQGDVQTPVCMLIVLKTRLRQFVDVDLQEDWFFSYIELLGRFKLWTIANNVIKLSDLPQVSMLNQQSTSIHIKCNMCNKPLQRSGWLCDRCKNITNKCCICSLPVRGLFLWCQGCSHGGHLQHIKDWFSGNTECPTGCGHYCEFT